MKRGFKTSFGKTPCPFVKVDYEQGIAYGWAIVSTIGGEPYYDLQGDHIPMDAVVKAAEEFMKNSRAGDEQHDEVRVGDVPFCMPVSTDTAKQLFGAELHQEGLVIGFKPYDKSLLKKIEASASSTDRRRGFSIGGSLMSADYVTGKRATPASGEALLKRDAAFVKDADAAIAAGRQPKQKRIFRDFQIDFISLVDWPAQEPALVSIVKSLTVEAGSLLRIRKDAALTSVDAGHQHVIDTNENLYVYGEPHSYRAYGESEVLGDQAASGVTSHAITPGASDPHRHHFVIDPKTGQITIQMTDGHTHTCGLIVPRVSTLSTVALDPATQLLPIAARAPEELRAGRSANSAPPKTPGVAVSAMDPTEQIEALQTEMAELKKQNEKLAKKLKKQGDDIVENVVEEVEDGAESIALWPDAHKTYFATLSKAEAREFLDMGRGKRDKLVKRSLDLDPVIYKCDDGTEIRKSDGMLMKRLAERNDAQAKQLAKANEEAETLRFRKRAEEVMGHYPAKADEIDALAAIVKAVDGIADEKTKKAALAALTAGDKALKAAFGRRGRGAPDGDDNDVDPGDQLEDMAREYAKKNKVPFAKAYEAVIETDEGQALYAAYETRSGNPGAGITSHIEDGDDFGPDLEVEDTTDDEAVETVQ